MGQMTHGVLLGVKKKAPKCFNNDWHEAIERFHAAAPTATAPSWIPLDDGQFVGYWIAIGEEDEPNMPGLNRPVALFDVECTPPYRKSSARARKAWDRFAKWCHDEHGIDLDFPRLWLLQVEVA